MADFGLTFRHRAILQFIGEKSCAMKEVEIYMFRWITSPTTRKAVDDLVRFRLALRSGERVTLTSRGRDQVRRVTLPPMEPLKPAPRVIRAGGLDHLRLPSVIGGVRVYREGVEA